MSSSQVKYCQVIILRLHFALHVMALESISKADVIDKSESGAFYHSVFKVFVNRAKPIFSKIESMNHNRARACIDTPFEEEEAFIKYKEKVKAAILPLCDTIVDPKSHFAPIEYDFFGNLKEHIKEL